MSLIGCLRRCPFQVSSSLDSTITIALILLQLSFLATTEFPKLMDFSPKGKGVCVMVMACVCVMPKFSNSLNQKVHGGLISKLKLGWTSLYFSELVQEPYCLL